MVVRTGKNAPDGAPRRYPSGVPEICDDTEGKRPEKHRDCLFPITPVPPVLNRLHKERLISCPRSASSSTL